MLTHPAVKGKCISCRKDTQKTAEHSWIGEVSSGLPQGQVWNAACFLGKNRNSVLIAALLLAQHLLVCAV